MPDGTSGLWSVLHALLMRKQRDFGEEHAAAMCAHTFIAHGVLYRHERCTASSRQVAGNMTPCGRHHTLRMLKALRCRRSVYQCSDSVPQLVPTVNAARLRLLATTLLGAAGHNSNCDVGLLWLDEFGIEHRTSNQAVRMQGACIVIANDSAAPGLTAAVALLSDAGCRRPC